MFYFGPRIWTNLRWVSLSEVHSEISVLFSSHATKVHSISQRMYSTLITDNNRQSPCWLLNCNSKIIFMALFHVLFGLTSQCNVNLDFNSLVNLAYKMGNCSWWIFPFAAFLSHIHGSGIPLRLGMFFQITLFTLHKCAIS